MEASAPPMLESSHPNTSSTEVSMDKKMSKNTKMMIGIMAFIILLIIILLGLFLLSRNNANSNNQQGDQINNEQDEVEDDEDLVEETPTPQPPVAPAFEPVIPAGWDVEAFGDCDVNIPVPPQTGEYVNTTDFAEYKWTYLETEAGGNYGMNYVAVVRQSPHSLETGEVLGNDDPSRAVTVSCGSNVAIGIGSQADLESFLQAELAEVNDSVDNDPELSQTLTYLGEEEKWGRTIYKYMFEGGIFQSGEPEYFAFDDVYIYRITKVGSTTDAFVDETTTNIFDNLEFI